MGIFLKIQPRNRRHINPITITSGSPTILFRNNNNLSIRLYNQKKGKNDMGNSICLRNNKLGSPVDYSNLPWKQHPNHNNFYRMGNILHRNASTYQLLPAKELQRVLNKLSQAF